MTSRRPSGLRQPCGLERDEVDVSIEWIGEHCPRAILCRRLRIVATIGAATCITPRVHPRYGCVIKQVVPRISVVHWALAFFCVIGEDLAIRMNRAGRILTAWIRLCARRFDHRRRR